MYKRKDNCGKHKGNAEKQAKKSRHTLRKWGLRFLILGFLGSCMLLCGCSTKSVDDQFISSLEDALSARWDITDNSDASTKAHFEEFIDAELNKIKDFQDQDFEDEELGKLAKEYIEILNTSKDILKDFGNDSKFESEWNKVKDDRTECLVKINKIKPLEFSSDRDKEYFEGLLSEGEVVAGVREIKKNVHFEKEKDEYDDTYHTYSAIVENTTNTEFETFWINVKLVDKDGHTVETQSPYTSDWKPGEKAKFEFISDEEFEKVEIGNIEYSY